MQPNLHPSLSEISKPFLVAGQLSLLHLLILLSLPPVQPSLLPRQLPHSPELFSARANFVTNVSTIQAPDHAG